MHPIEAIGFGGMLIAVLLMIDCDVVALLFFLLINWLYGTIAHSGIPVNNMFLRWCVGDSRFHHDHHTQLA